MSAQVTDAARIGCGRCQSLGAATEVIAAALHSIGVTPYSKASMLEGQCDTPLLHLQNAQRSRGSMPASPAAGVTIEQIQKDTEKSAAAAEAVLSQEAGGDSLASQWRASDPQQADKNEGDWKQ